jgi:acyl dehydratase
MWGQDFLARGLMTARFYKPVYDGETIDVHAEDSDGGLALEITSRGETCATASASLPEASPSVKLDDFRSVAPIAVREPVTPDSYPRGGWLGISPYAANAEETSRYLRDISESEALFAQQGFLHDGLLLRTMNSVLMENAVLGPWIHVGSTLQHIAPARVGDALTVRARVTDNYERKGHRLVDLDGIIVANGDRPVARCQHTAIYQPRERIAA